MIGQFTAWCGVIIGDTLYELKAHFDQPNSTDFEQFSKMVAKAF
jgi:hypothetical protein